MGVTPCDGAACPLAKSIAGTTRSEGVASATESIVLAVRDTERSPGEEDPVALAVPGTVDGRTDETTAETASGTVNETEGSGRRRKKTKNRQHRQTSRRRERRSRPPASSARP